MTSPSTTRLDRCFARLLGEKRPAFVAFSMAADPDFDASLDRLRLLVRGGVDVIEVGYPFSDPILDGATIQDSNRRGRAAGGSLARALDLCAAYREEDEDTPLILMGYANPPVVMGVAAFARRAASSGVDGVIVADMPVREAGDLLAALAAVGLVMIPLATPNLAAREFTLQHPGLGGFLYCIPVAGPTGGPSASSAQIEAAVARCRAAVTMPVLVGFGVKTPAMAGDVARLADGVIVGTALIDCFDALRREASPGSLRALALAEIGAYRKAIDAARADAAERP